jgi:hypothetical protein
MIGSRSSAAYARSSSQSVLYAQIPDESLICATARGGEKIHPCLQAWLQLERASGEFGARLGPEADRAKPPKGRLHGANSAPDRVGEPLKLTRIK